jgi:nucleoside-diphosphate-sugar epimerase
MFHALYELPVVTLRLFMVYGPAQRDVSKLVPYVTLASLRGEAPKLSSGLREVDWIFVDDVVDAFLAAGCASGLGGQVIDVGSGQLVTIRTLVEQLVRAVDPAIAPVFGALPDRPMEQVRRADAARSRSLLGWSARTPLAEGLAQTVAWYRRALESGSS